MDKFNRIKDFGFLFLTIASISFIGTIVIWIYLILLHPTFFRVFGLVVSTLSSIYNIKVLWNKLPSK